MESPAAANGAMARTNGCHKRKHPSDDVDGASAGAGAGAGAGNTAAGSVPARRTDNAGDTAVLERGSHPYGVQPMGNMWCMMAGRGQGGQDSSGSTAAAPKAARLVRTRDVGLGRLACLPDSVIQRVCG